MNSRKYSTDPAVLLEQGKAIMTSSDESRFLFRVFAVNMVLSGTSLLSSCIRTRFISRFRPPLPLAGIKKGVHLRLNPFLDVSKRHTVDSLFQRAASSLLQSQRCSITLQPLTQSAPFSVSIQRPMGRNTIPMSSVWQSTYMTT